MKDNLFEVLLSLFETGLSQLQKDHQATELNSAKDAGEELASEDDAVVYFRSHHDKSTRVFTYEEQMKLTKASYQFLVRMKLWQVIDEKSFEEIINQLQFSDSHMVTLEETKWTIRNVLSSDLNEDQIAFLDLVLYKSRDELALH